MNWILKHWAPVYFLLPWVDKLLLLFLLWWICPSAWLLYYKMATLQRHTCSLILVFFDCEGLTPNPDIYCRSFYLLGDDVIKPAKHVSALAYLSATSVSYKGWGICSVKRALWLSERLSANCEKILHSLQPCMTTTLWQIKAENLENLSEVHWHLFALSENVMMVQCRQTQTLCYSLQSHHISNHWDILGY